MAETTSGKITSENGQAFHHASREIHFPRVRFFERCGRTRVTKAEYQITSGDAATHVAVDHEANSPEHFLLNNSLFPRERDSHASRHHFGMRHSQPPSSTSRSVSTL